MAKLTYWVAPCLDDSLAYSIRGRTRKEVVAELAKRAQEFRESGMLPPGYGKPVKHTIEYRDAFDLMEQCLGEGRGLEPHD